MPLVVKRCPLHGGSQVGLRRASDDPAVIHELPFLLFIFDWSAIGGMYRLEDASVSVLPNAVNCCFPLAEGRTG